MILQIVDVLLFVVPSIALWVAAMILLMKSSNNLLMSWKMAGLIVGMSLILGSISFATALWMIQRL